MDQDLKIVQKNHGARVAEDFFKACKRGGMTAEGLKRLELALPTLPSKNLAGTPDELAFINSIVKEEMQAEPKTDKEDKKVEADKGLVPVSVAFNQLAKPPKSVVDLMKISWEDFFALAESMNLLQITEMCAYDGWDPLPTRLKFEGEGKITLNTVMGVVAAWVQRSLTEKKKLQKVATEGKKKMEELLRAIANIGGSNTVSLTRFMACYPDALFYYRCYLIKKDKFRALSGQQNVTFKIPGAISFLNFGTIYNTVHWKNQYDALSKFYNGNFQQNATIADMVEKKRPEWNQKVISVAHISKALRGAYSVGDKGCAKHKDIVGKEKVDNNWGIFAHDIGACGTCIFEAMKLEGTLVDDVGLSGYVINAPAL